MAALCNVCSIDPNALTVNQWRYLLVRQEFLESGRIPTIAVCCKAAHVNRVTVWRWFQQPPFLVAYQQAFRAHVEVRDAEVDYVVQTMAMRGNPRAMEANLRRRNKWEGGHSSVEYDQGGNPAAPGGGVNIAQVQFINLPRPPTPAERDALNPPPGSAECVILKVQS